MKSFCFCLTSLVPEGGCQGLEFFVAPLSSCSLSPRERAFLAHLVRLSLPSSSAHLLHCGQGSLLLPTSGSLLTRSSVPAPFADLLWAPWRPGASGLPPLADTSCRLFPPPRLLIEHSRGPVHGWVFTVRKQAAGWAGSWHRLTYLRDTEPDSMAFPRG